MGGRRSTWYIKLLGKNDNSSGAVLRGAKDSSRKKKNGNYIGSRRREHRGFGTSHGLIKLGKKGGLL